MEYVVKRTSNDELMHYGVPGMKWGVRRYQNADGSYTPAGRSRQLKNDYKSYGASSSFRNRHARDEYYDSKKRDEVSKSIDRITTDNHGKRYTDKQRARDYDKAIRNQIGRAHV